MFVIVIKNVGFAEEPPEVYMFNELSTARAALREFGETAEGEYMGKGYLNPHGWYQSNNGTTIHLIESFVEENNG